MDLTLQAIIYKRSYDNMAVIKNRLETSLRRTPEWEIWTRQDLEGKIEKLRLIRIDMKKAIQKL